MKIALISATYLPTRNGVTIHLASLKRKLEGMGHEVWILAPKNLKTEEEERVVRFPSIYNIWATNYPLPLALNIPNKIKGVNFDIIHLHHPFGVANLAKKLAKINHCPLVFTNHTQYLAYTNYYLPIISVPVRFFMKKYLKYFYRNFDRVIGSTKDIGAEIRNIYPEVNFSEIPVGFDSSRFDSEYPDNLKERIGLTTKEEYILYVGRIAKEKNIENLLSVFTKVQRKFPHLRLVLAGEGDILQSLKERANKKIIFLGQPSDDILIGLYKECLLFTSMSTSEVLPLTFSEAGYCSAPLLGLDSLGIRDIIIDGVNGFLAKNPDDYMKKMVEMLENRELLHELSSNSKESVEKYSDIHNIKKIERLYLSLQNK